MKKIGFEVTEGEYQEFREFSYKTGIPLARFCRDTMKDALIKLRKSKTRLIKKRRREIQINIRSEERKKIIYYTNVPTNLFKAVIRLSANCLLALQPINMGWVQLEIKLYKKIFSQVPPGPKKIVKQQFQNITEFCSNEHKLYAYFDNATTQQKKYAAKFGYIQNKNPEEITEAYGIRLAEQYRQEEDKSATRNISM
ncbi:MAG: hypothetical protein GTO02_13625 [Candidatus Dadabacteria bacterium]|nr:hypothetical protein [Candidatus Dadabacteria bacterium]